LAKKYAYDNIEELVSLEEQLVSGSKEMGGVSVFNGEALMKKELKEKMGYWQWDYINEEVQCLRWKVGNDNKIKNIKEKYIVAMKRRFVS
jgi:hypothetical protein